MSSFSLVAKYCITIMLAALCIIDM